MFTISRFAAAGLLAGTFLLSGCAGDAPLLSKPWSALRPTAKASKPKKPSDHANMTPKMGPSDDIPTAASVGLMAKPNQ